MQSQEKKSAVFRLKQFFDKKKDRLFPVNNLTGQQVGEEFPDCCIYKVQFFLCRQAHPWKLQNSFFPVVLLYVWTNPLLL
jgi:hypothetical protein